MRLILGSGSPRRRQFFTDLGLSFEVSSADIDETPIQDEDAPSLVERLAVEKARAVAHSREDKEIRVLGADTVVVINNSILGKPESEDDALRMLLQLSGCTHQVLGGAALVDGAGSVLYSQVSTTEVDFINFDKELAAKYVASGESLDKAGSYAIQGRGVQFVREIRGSFSNVVGLDVALVAQWLRQEGFL